MLPWYTERHYEAQVSNCHMAGRAEKLFIKVTESEYDDCNWIQESTNQNIPF